MMIILLIIMKVVVKVNMKKRTKLSSFGVALEAFLASVNACKFR